MIASIERRDPKKVSAVTASSILETLSRGGEYFSNDDDYCKLLEKKTVSELYSSLTTISKSCKQLEQLWNNHGLFFMDKFLPFAHGAISYKHPNANTKIDLIKSLNRGAIIFDSLFKTGNNDVKGLRKAFSSVRRVLDLDKRKFNQMSSVFNIYINFLQQVSLKQNLMLPFISCIKNWPPDQIFSFETETRGHQLMDQYFFNSTPQIQILQYLN